ncbi:long-chain-fatty-acid--CoA ligase [Nocardioides campestrisoli]|uniref:long-chain-fatty-acid--CoA ligase n=1 Tax=Nocardioides campestrisoli TaxID=2736757 RepID=UPI001CD746CD|nr:long-chain-fatty-acid--CoA ligase [Nocardioides campestrisoli]
MPNQPALPGLMMDVQLTTQLLHRRLLDVTGDCELVAVQDASGTARTQTFRETALRAGRLAAALARLGVREGDRVGTFSWNTAEHVEAYWGVMGMGAVLHTINLRLHSDQIAYTVQHADDRVVLLDGSLAEQFLPVLERCPGVEHVVVIGDLPAGVEVPGALHYEELLADESPDFPWPDLDERAAASLCYTSGTTGDPKGVLYSHRSITLHAIAMSGTEVYRLGADDRALSLVPLFHAMGWGLPFVTAVVGADLILPGRFLQPAPLGRIITEHRATWSAGVPTLWMDLLSHLDSPEGRDVSLESLRRILSGGTQVPTEMMRDYQRRFDVEVVQGWGMTEIFPGATVSQDLPGITEELRWQRRSLAGRISPLYEVRVNDATAGIQPHDGVATGEIEVRGPAVAGGYFRAPGTTEEKVTGDGWLRTGDVGTVDPQGWLRISDRAKDAIKSGGEWISSVDLENALMGHPSVREAAVVGRPDPRWSERPHAFVVVDGPVDEAELRTFLEKRVAKWWIPDTFDVVDHIPRTSTGKFNKLDLRERLVGSEEAAR